MPPPPTPKNLEQAKVFFFLSEEKTRVATAFEIFFKKPILNSCFSSLLQALIAMLPSSGHPYLRLR